nr:MAG TPA: hypothetical protein [Caudoviricetes sp.]
MMRLRTARMPVLRVRIMMPLRPRPWVIVKLIGFWLS